MTTGILLVNTGSPDSPSVEDVRAYLDEFLMDGRVLDFPYPIRRLIVSLFILPSRSRHSAEAYRSIWWDEGSPLIAISRRVQQKLQDRIDAPVALAMRYGHPSIQQGLQELLDRRVNRLLLVPLFPHYAMSTYESIVAAVRQTLSRLSPETSLDVLPPFYDDPLYIDALAASARDHLAEGFDHLLFSYHGLPERHLRKTDPTGKHCLVVPDCCNVASPAHATCYRAQVFRTTQAFVRRARVPEGKYSIAFQSRLGRDRWLLPATDAELARLASIGVKKLLLICPAFVSDCLETLEEIGIGGREAFLGAGGLEFRLIPCLNDHPRWIDVLAQWCERRMALASPAP